MCLNQKNTRILIHDPLRLLSNICRRLMKHLKASSINTLGMILHFKELDALMISIWLLTVVMSSLGSFFPSNFPNLVVGRSLVFELPKSSLREVKDLRPCLIFINPHGTVLGGVGHSPLKSYWSGVAPP